MAFPIADSPLEIWKHLAVKLAFNCLSTGTMPAMGRIAAQDWSKGEEPSPVQVALRALNGLVHPGRHNRGR